MSFCAICTSECGPFVTGMFGRDSAPVLVCRRCNDEHPSTGRYGFDDGSAGAREDRTHHHPNRTPRRGHR